MRSGTMPSQQQQRRQRNDGQSLPPPPRDPYSSNSRAEETDGLPAPESWIEVSSHPSSSSVSSIGEEIVTTGLRVGNSYPPRRRRLNLRSYAQPSAQRQQQQHPRSTVSAQAVAAALASASSQEEYEESDSEDDRVLTSSTENITSPQGAGVGVVGSTPLRQVRRHPESDSSDEDDDDENATALGRRPPAEPFRPQPNAFTHPPSHLSHRHSASSAIPSHHPSFSQRASTRFDRRASNFMTPADNDAALRASLTTLLSCAAAARGRPKDSGEQDNKGGEAPRPAAAPAASNQPVGLRMLSESELNTPSSPPAAATTTATTSSPSSSSPPQPQKAPRSSSPRTRATRPSSGEKIKRSSTPGTSGSRPPPPRATKKKKTAASAAAAAAAGDDAAATIISPTLLTWVVSAGVVVLVSVVGFGAGYVIGREVGRQEAALGGARSLAGNASSSVFEGGGGGGGCGAEVFRVGGSGGTLRRFRWGGGVSSVAA
ncbi:hypothetical protein MGN70_005679 [Eutypa lata]|nr:hypothetical protein MGN70_005679 [Eutypa lata]